MRPAKPISEEAQASLGRLLKKCTSKADYQRLQCIWLRASLGLDSVEIAQAVGWTPGRVRVVQHRYFKAGEPALLGTGRGGRRRENLSLAEEERLLAGFVEKSKSGAILVVHEVQAAYEKLVGRAVAASTIYRMLARHDWRKVAPRPSHPKADPAAREEFKKNSPRWSPRKSNAKFGRGKSSA